MVFDLAIGKRVLGKRYPPLSSELARQLGAVPITNNLYRPCQVILDDGTRLDRVYVVDAAPWFQQWGVWPEEDGGKQFLPLQRVSQILDSPSRLPAFAAAKLYATGESGMGYTIFTVCFQDGTNQIVQAGNAIDFIEYPAGQSPETVLDVLPHVGRDDPARASAPDYHWCLYDGFEATPNGN